MVSYRTIQERFALRTGQHKRRIPDGRRRSRFAGRAIRGRCATNLANNGQQSFRESTQDHLATIRQRNSIRPIRSLISVSSSLRLASGRLPFGPEKWITRLRCDDCTALLRISGDSQIFGWSGYALFRCRLGEKNYSFPESSRKCRSCN
jgi:hypothetical protein